MPYKDRQQGIDAQKKWRKANPDKISKYSADHKAKKVAKGLCIASNCHEKLVTKIYCEAHRQANSSRAKSYREELRKEVIYHYGNKCACERCGETEFKFLTIDHINNDGYLFRKNNGSSLGIYLDIKKRNYPDDLQVLCWNCNEAKKNYGQCPHNEQHFIRIPEDLLSPEDKKRLDKDLAEMARQRLSALVSAANIYLS